MTRSHLDKLRTRLLEEKARLEADRAALLAHEGMASELGELSSVDTNHPADVGTEMFERERQQALNENLLKLIKQTNDALAKIDAGTYGVCDHCGGAIPDARLQALPYATLCIACQSRLETE
jgi:RNA polymerase-binding protein DksA